MRDDGETAGFAGGRGATPKRGRDREEMKSEESEIRLAVLRPCSLAVLAAFRAAAPVARAFPAWFRDSGDPDAFPGPPSPVGSSGKGRNFSKPSHFVTFSHPRAACDRPQILDAQGFERQRGCLECRSSPAIECGFRGRSRGETGVRHLRSPCFDRVFSLFPRPHPGACSYPSSGPSPCVPTFSLRRPKNLPASSESRAMTMCLRNSRREVILAISSRE